ncbi:MAG: ABC transporter permease [Acidobacteriota bacterium]
MSPFEMLGFAARALYGHRLRTGLSLVGMTIGVAAVVVLTALGEGARRYVVAQFQGIGTNLVIVVPGKSETTGMVPGISGVPNDLTLDDAAAIRRQVRGIRRLAPVVVATETVSRGARRRQVAVIGGNREYFRIREVGSQRGDILPPLDDDRGAAVVVLGVTTAKELFGEADPIGEVVRVGSWRMRVIGVLESKGVQVGVDVDDLAVVPVATAMRMFDRSSLFRILAQVDGPADLDPVKDGIVELITERHGEEDITCLTQDAVVDTLSSILGVLTLAIGGIAGVSLTVAGIGIMNVMLVSVAERTSEIGLLQAIGARRGQILAVFLTEAALLSLLGGLLGLGVGALGVEALGLAFPQFDAQAPRWAIVAALGVSLVVGVVFGFVPARHATRLDPVTALGRG